MSLEKTLFIVSSITYALKGREILSKNGISASLQKIHNLTKNGCGYAINVNGDTAKAQRILQSARIPVLETRNDAG